MIFKCSCCGEDSDFSNSDDYVGAVEQWERFGGKCYACAKGFCHCKNTPQDRTKGKEVK